MSRWPILLVLFSCGLAACTSLSEDERSEVCANTDWWQFGMTDGAFGVPVASRQERFDRCASVGRPPDIAAYRQGHERGLEDYCTESSGYHIGREGKEYQGVCPPSLEADFLAGLKRGEEDRPSLAVTPHVGVGVGIGPGGIRPHLGIGLGLGCFLFC